MKNYSKVGNRNGRPAYRTPADFKIRRDIKVKKDQACYQHRSNLQKSER